MSDPQPSELDVELRHPQGRRQISAVWLVPIVAIGIALAIAVEAVLNRGPVIEIVFAEAEGVTENETELRYRDVTVGQVEDIQFTERLREVVLSVRLDPGVAEYVDADARFWIVAPEVSAQGVTGLSTLLGGVYLQGSWDGEPGVPETRFTGLPQPPLITGTEEGIEILLRAPRTGGISGGAPVLYKGVEVGVLDRPRLTEDGETVTGRAFVRAPYDRLVNSASRFWAVSGISLDISADGVDFDIANLTSLIRGGVAFDTIGRDPQDIAPGHAFDVFASREDAGTATPPDPEGPELVATAIFDRSVEGLAPGAPLTYGGIRIGSVVDTRGRVTSEADAGAAVQLRVDFRILPERLGIDPAPQGGDVIEQTEAVLRRLVDNGFRLRLAPQGLIGRSLKVDLVEISDAVPARLSRDGRGRPLVPTVMVDLPDPAMTARETLQRLRNLPIEQIAAEVQEILANVNTIIASDGVRAAPAEVTGLIADTRALISGPEVAGTLAAAERALNAAAAIAAEIERSAAVETLVQALERSDTIARGLAEAADGLPALVEEITAVAGTARALPLEALVTEASALLASADGLVSDPDTQALPGQLASALGDLETAASEASVLAARLNDPEAIAAVRSALLRVESIAASVDDAAARLPAVLADVEALAAEAAALPLQTLVAETTDLAARAASIAGDPLTQDLPERLDAALAEVAEAAAAAGALGRQVDESAAVETLASALARLDSVAASVDTAADGLPDLVARVDAIAAEVQSLPVSELVSEATGLVASAEALVSSEDTAQIPAALAEALDELALVLADLRAGGAVENVNATFAAANDAATAIADAADGLPELAQRLDGLVAQAETVLLAYGGRSEFNAQTLAALRDLRESAQAVTSLARTIERKPNSLLIGR